MTAQVPQGKAFARAAHLKRGINLSMWYAQSSDYSATRLATYTTEDDFKLVRSLGFDHVRLSIDPEPLIAEKQSGRLRTDAMQRLDRTVQQLTAEGLVVVLDIHPEESYKKELAEGEDGVARWLAFWTAFAHHYATTDPEHVYFEIFNEPNMRDAYRWSGIEARAVATIRAQAPQHTIIATGAMWGAIDGLMTIEPFRDGNIIYTFHEYNPMWFTHQGATWGTQGWVWLHGIPYPSTPDSVDAFLPQVPDERVRLEVARYGLERWNAERLNGEVAQAAAWAARRGVPLWCGEFGVYRDFAPPAMRAQWLSDVRRALEANNIGWAMWDYQGSFALVTKTNGTTTADPAILHALGLRK
jgi:aryl-phospho-beta-D-glucosidase BglC (GH1 family)